MSALAFAVVRATLVELGELIDLVYGQ